MFLFDQINGNQTWVGYICCCDQYLLNVCTINDHYISCPFPLLIYSYFPIHMAFPLFSAFDLANVDANKTELKLMGSGFRRFRFTI